MTLSSEIFGLPIPDAGPVFATALYTSCPG